MRKVVLAVLLSGTIAAPAMAQTYSPFTGPRVEGLVGYDKLKSGEADDGVDTSDNEGDESIDGVAYGVGVGYDFDLGGVVAGVEAEYMGSSAEQEADEVTPDGLGFTSRVEAGRDIYVGGRIGFQAGPSTLIYGKGGYTNTSIKAALESEDDSLDFDTHVDGWRIGAGVEQLFGPNLYGKLEYRYSNYDNIEFNYDDDAFDSDIDLDRHQVVASVGMRF